MDSLWTEHRGQRYHVLGIELTDPGHVFQTKRVIHCCIGLMVVLAIRTFLLLIIGESLGATLLSLVFNISIPAFGYLGARDGNSSLMCVFVALMLLNAANALAILAMVAYASLTGLPQVDQSGEVHPFHLTVSMWIQVVLISAWAFMALVAAYHANNLFKSLSEEDQRAEAHRKDPEAGLPPMETQLEEIEADSFGLPAGALHESDIDDELNSPIRRKKQGSVSSQEKKHNSPSE